MAILTTARAQPSGNVVLPEPGYPPFVTLAEIFGIAVRRYPLQREWGWKLDVGGLEPAAEVPGESVVVVGDTSKALALAGPRIGGSIDCAPSFPTPSG